MDSTPITAQLVARVYATEATTLSDAARRMLGGAILGVLGTGVAGAQTDAAAALTRHVAAAGCTGGVPVWGRKLRTWAPLSALANGMAAHLFDWDDTNESAQSHLTVTIIPAVFALGEATGISGRQALNAYVAGVELAALLGRAANPMLVERGWHATGVLGSFAAAAACSRVLGLDARQCTHALGIVASMASALMANLGTDTKALHAGLAARNGIDAALLAQSGLHANPDVFAGKLNPLTVFAGIDEQRLVAVCAEPMGKSEIETVGLILKAYPCCASAHRSVEAVLHLCATHSLRREDIRGIHCGISSLAYHKLHHQVPRSPLEAKLSLAYCLTAAIEDQGLIESSFNPGRLNDAEFAQRMRHIQVEIHPEQTGRVPPLEEFTEVAIALADGRTLRHRIVRPTGTPQRPLTVEAQHRKFRSCAEPVLGAERSTACIAAVASLDQLPRISDLTVLLEPQA